MDASSVLLVKGIPFLIAISVLALRSYGVVK